MAIPVSNEPCPYPTLSRNDRPAARCPHNRPQKENLADFRHRALRHHAEGIFLAEQLFGVTVTFSTGRVVPVRLIGEQHVLEDLERIPSFADWVRAIRPEPWMGRTSSIPGGDGLLQQPGLPGTELPDLQAALKEAAP